MKKILFLFSILGSLGACSFSGSTDNVSVSYTQPYHSTVTYVQPYSSYGPYYARPTYQNYRHPVVRRYNPNCRCFYWTRAF